MRKLETDYINSKIEQGLKENNQKPFWRYVKSRRQDSSGIAPLKNGPFLESDSIGKAKILLKQFCSVFTQDSSSPQLDIPGNPFPEADPLRIDQNGIEKLLLNQNASKAAGTVKLPCQVLKHCASHIAPILTIIFSRSANSGPIIK